MSVCVMAMGAVSPLGRGQRAICAGDLGLPAQVAIARDEELQKFGLTRPFAARVPTDCLEASAPASIQADRATHLLYTAFADCLAQVRQRVSGLDRLTQRIALGTSSGGMRTAERLFSATARADSISVDLLRDATYFAPIDNVLDSLGIARSGAIQFVTACAASTWAIGQAVMWLESRAADLVFAGGYDAVGMFVASGFEALRATGRTLPNPFRSQREGMALGEGACVLALVRAGEDSDRHCRFFVSGFGASTDAVHITAPDRTGSGLALAGARALKSSGISEQDVMFVSAHATATTYNDAMEAKAITSLLGTPSPVVHPFKAQIGHTLGAAGVLESVAAGDALARGILPAAAGSGPIDPDAEVTLLDSARLAPANDNPAVLKLSAAFGGANAALVLGTRPTSRKQALRPVYLGGYGWADRCDVPHVAAALGQDPEKFARVDKISQWAAAATVAMFATTGALSDMEETAIIVGHALATIDINEAFFHRVLARGPAFAEPRAFPATSPNLCAGQLAIWLGARGPSAAVCGSIAGAVEALEVGFDLIHTGRAKSALILGIDLFHGVSEQLRDRLYPQLAPQDGATCVLLCDRGQTEVAPPRGLTAPGHLALLAWAKTTSLQAKGSPTA